MANLQQQKNAIDAEAQRAKDEADKIAFDDRQSAAEEEIARIRKLAEDEVKQVEYDAQR